MTLADALADPAPGHFDYPVVDRTGLKGAYNIAISWTPPGHFLRDSRVTSADGGAAVAPNGDLNIFQALKKQLGVKLVMER